jgi:hypothetical protein
MISDDGSAQETPGVRDAEGETGATPSSPLCVRDFERVSEHMTCTSGLSGESCSGERGRVSSCGLTAPSCMAARCEGVACLSGVVVAAD